MTDGTQGIAPWMEPAAPGPAGAGPAGTAPALPGSWRRPGPLRNAFAFAGLTTLLAACMLADSLLFPLPGEANAAFNALAARVTGVLFLVAAGSLACLLAGRYLAGRLLVVLYGCGVVSGLSVVLGPGTGIDVLGSTCLIFAPALIFARSERRALAASCLAGLATVVFMQGWIRLGPGPLHPIGAEFLGEVRSGLVVVACCVGLLVVYLYWSAELARAAAAREHARSEALLLNVLPAAVAERLKAGEHQIADGLDEVTILFADIVGFTRFAASRPPAEVVGVLNRLFSRFDALCVAHGVEKVKTIGDGYMAVAGAPASFPGHARAAARVALGMQAAMREEAAAYPELALRVGLNTGPAVAGVMGTVKFAYDVWGDAVNLASRLESAAAPGTVLVSETTCRALGAGAGLTPVGEVTLKGKGPVAAWRLDGPV